VKAVEALSAAMFYISGLYSNKILNKPGAVIQKLSSSVRDALSNLKSSDIGPDKIMDSDIFGTEEYYSNKKITDLKLNFDKKLK